MLRLLFLFQLLFLSLTSSSQAKRISHKGEFNFVYNVGVNYSDFRKFKDSKFIGAKFGAQVGGGLRYEKHLFFISPKLRVVLNQKKRSKESIFHFIFHQLRSI